MKKILDRARKKVTGLGAEGRGPRKSKTLFLTS